MHIKASAGDPYRVCVCVCARAFIANYCYKTMFLTDFSNSNELGQHHVPVSDWLAHSHHIPVFCVRFQLRDFPGLNSILNCAHTRLYAPFNSNQCHLNNRDWTTQAHANKLSSAENRSW